VLGDRLFATVAVGPYFTLWEDGGAGWFQSIQNAISLYGDYGHPANDSIRQPPFAFSDSTNALEDVLGLVAALAGSRAVLNSSLTHTTGSAEVTFTRIGPGRLFAIVYALVPLVLGFVMIGLMVITKSEAAKYQSSKMKDLLRLGGENTARMEAR
jgi:hypothetical protein